MANPRSGATFYHDLEQRSPEWFDLRRGLLTASKANKLVTPGGKVSTQWRGEIGRLVAESMGLQPPEEENGFMSADMQHGIDLEPEAVRAFEFITGLTAEPCGFVKRGLLGYSPDALTNQWTPLQVKCPKPSTHIEWMLQGGLPDKHWPQVYFEMHVAQAERAWFMSYCPGLESIIVLVHKDDPGETETDTVFFQEFNPARARILEKAIIEFEATYRHTYLKITGEEL